MSESKSKNMTYARARNKVAKIAKSIGKSYYSIKYEETHSRGAVRAVTCSVYIDGYSWHNSQSFERAILSIEMEVGTKKLGPLSASQAPRNLETGSKKK